MSSRKRITYRPGKTAGAFGGVVGGIFVLLGIFFVVPTFGAFGIVWTLIAIAICGMSIYTSFGKNYAGPEIHIDDEGLGDVLGRAAPGGAESPEARMKQLRAMYDQRLITQEEYEEKRKEILKEL